MVVRFGRCGVLRPVYFERIDFLGTDIAGKQGRVVRSKSKPSRKRSGGQASDILNVDYVLNLAIAQPKADHAVMKSLSIVQKIDIPSECRTPDHRIVCGLV